MARGPGAAQAAWNCAAPIVLHFVASELLTVVGHELFADRTALLEPLLSESLADALQLCDEIGVRGADLHALVGHQLEVFRRHVDAHLPTSRLRFGCRIEDDL